MDTIRLDHKDETGDLERLLEKAGISYTVVDRCPLATCEVCIEQTLPAAA